MKLNDEQYEKLHDGIWQLIGEIDIDVESIVGTTFPTIQRITFQDHTLKQQENVNR
jgi:hypothetical protein